MSSNTSHEKERLVDDDPDRERGFLTPHDRAFLLAEPGEGVREDMSDTAARQKLHKIRKRFRNGLLDIQYLLLLDELDISQLFPRDEFGEYELGALHGSWFTVIYHLTRVQSDREKFLDTLEFVVADDVVREYATEHGVYAPVELTTEFNVPPPDECPPLEAVREAVERGEELPDTAHLALDLAGRHPNPDAPIQEVYGRGEPDGEE